MQVRQYIKHFRSFFVKPYRFSSYTSYTSVCIVAFCFILFRSAIFHATGNYLTRGGKVHGFFSRARASQKHSSEFYNFFCKKNPPTIASRVPF